MGGDAKYGRLFTEADVRLLMREAAAEAVRHPEVTWGSADAAEALDRFCAAAGECLTFPPDEPLFLLRASEPGAVNLLAAIYNSDEFNDGAGYVRDSAHYGELVQLQFEFSDWQAAHPDRVKAPD